MLRALAVCGVLLASLGLGSGCGDDDLFHKYGGDRSRYECGFAGNGCWGGDASAPSCNKDNKSVVCNTARQGEALGVDQCPATFGVCELRPDGGS